MRGSMKDSIRLRWGVPGQKGQPHDLTEAATCFGAAEDHIMMYASSGPWQL